MEINYTKHLNNAMCASLYGIDSSLNQYLSNEQTDFPTTEEPIWILGCEYNSLTQLKELKDDIKSKIWITYRKNFASIGGNGPTSDQGWGCMLRCGQMVLAQAFIVNNLGRNWRWIGCAKNKDYNEGEKSCNEDGFEDLNLNRKKTLQAYEEDRKKHNTYLKILKQFQDKKTCTYSVHQIALMGASEDKPVGTWFGPNTIAQTLKRLSLFDHTNNFKIYIALDNVVVINEIKAQCKSNVTEKSIWKPLLLFIPLRLGLTEINNIYFRALKETFKLEQSLGIIGGKPNHALYFIGFVNNELIYLDPHKTQQMVDLDEMAPIEQFCDDLSYHCKNFARMDLSQMDPSISLCFFFKTEKSFDDWKERVKENVFKNEAQCLFEICESRPKQWICTDSIESQEFTDYHLSQNDKQNHDNQAAIPNFIDLNEESCSEEEFELLG